VFPIVWPTLKIAGLKHPKVRYLPKMDAITRPTAALSEACARGWYRKTVEYGRSGGDWTSYSNSHLQRQRQQQQTTKPRHPALPARVYLSFLPPGAGLGRDKVPTSLTVRPLIDNLCPPEPNRAPRTTVTAPARGPATSATFTAPRAPPSPRCQGETPSKLFPLLSDAISRIFLSVRVSHFDFCVAGDLNST